MNATEWASLIALFATMWLVALSPLLIPFIVVLRGGPTVPRRWLFVLLSAVCTYGFFGLFSVVVWLPIEFLAAKVAAQLAIDAPAIAGWVNPALNFVYPWISWLGFGLALVFVIMFIRYFWRRWPRIAPVL